MKKLSKIMFKHLFTKSSLYKYLIGQTLVLIMFVVFVSKSPIATIKSYIVGSGSMSPVLTTKTLIIVRQKSSYQVGDIITFVPDIPTDFSTVTHRIHALGGNVYVTKGDANLKVDRFLVLPEQIIGSLFFENLILGKIYLFLKSNIGLLTFFYLPTTLITYVETKRILKLLDIHI